ncbi:MAG: T9SS type A sorting domain-containing protein [Ignavibacteriaceae bacterium]|nr:T9SS type A sorting domain-containing protein [Ignavibacteriaceae bacterium]
MKIFANLLILLSTFLPANLIAQQLSSDYFQKNIEVYFSFEISSRDLIKELTNVISIDNVEGTSVYAYANENEYNAFLSYNIDHAILPKPGELIIPEMSDEINEITDWNVYPTYDAYVSMMNMYSANYPSICKLIDAGITVQGRKILLVKISDNVNVREAEPQFLYTSSIHGDETTGYVLMLRLIDSLLTSYGTNPRIMNMVNNAEIWINPNANPDGTYHGGNNTVNGATRYNANGYDLNRNFPDPIYGVHPNQQQETAVFRNLAEQNNFVLCANFHGGTEVVNYPWDTWTSGYPDYVSHADDNWYQFISHLYADTCQAYAPSNYMNGYDDGITNGGAWYVINHGRQDYMNWYMKSREVTIEISDTKLLPPSQLPAHWEYNRRSFLNYIESIFYGVRGIVTDTLNHPLNAIITVLNHDTLHSEIRTDSANGNYHRMLAPGVYSFKFTAEGHYPKTINNVVVNNFQTTILNVELIPEFIPVELISFSAEVFNNEVKLNWQTATETNNSGFEIERTSPRPSPYQGEGGKAGRGWEIIGFVQGSGTTTEPRIYSFIDENVSSGNYQYRLKQIDFDGSFNYSNIVEVQISSPLEFSLEQNYPNPFNPSTKIKYVIPSVETRHASSLQMVSLKVYDVLGNEIATLVNEEKPAGSYEVEFSARGGSAFGGNAYSLPSGVYFYKLQAGNLIQTKKMILVK